MLEIAEVVNENKFDVPLLMLQDCETVALWNVIAVDSGILRNVFVNLKFHGKWVKYWWI
jgi:hypothetical protein